MTIERKVEADLKQYCESLGMFYKKLKPASESGWPDRSIMYRGRVMFLELKKKGEKPEPLQKYMLTLLTKAGFDARWSDDFEQMKLIVLAWRNHVDEEHRQLAGLRTSHRTNG